MRKISVLSILFTLCLFIIKADATVCFLPSPEGENCADLTGGRTPADEVACADYLGTLQDENCYDCACCPSNPSLCNCTQKHTLPRGYVLENGECKFDSCLGFTSSKKDEHCYDCECCPTDSSKCNCTVRATLAAEYILDGQNCIKDPCDESYNLGTPLDERCFACHQCSIEASARNGKYSCTLKTNMGNYEVHDGVCRLIPGSDCMGLSEQAVTERYSPIWKNCYTYQTCSDRHGNLKYHSLEAKANLTSSQTNESYFLNGQLCMKEDCSPSKYQYADEASCLSAAKEIGTEHYANCYACEKCSSDSSAHPNNYALQTKSDINKDYFLSGQLCMKEECPADEYKYDSEASCLAAAENLGTKYYANCYACEKCSSDSSAFPGNYTIKTKSDIRGWSINSEGQCVPAVCPGMYLCGENRVGFGKTCKPKGFTETWHEGCEVPETCFKQNVRNQVTVPNTTRVAYATCSYSADKQDESKYLNLGLYKSYECTQISGEKIIYYNKLLNSGLDCQGNRSPLYGKKPCEAEADGCYQVNGETVKVDGYYWCDTCPEENQPQCYYDKLNKTGYLLHNGVRYISLPGKSTIRRPLDLMPKDKHGGFCYFYDRYKDHSAHTCRDANNNIVGIAVDCQLENDEVDCFGNDGLVPPDWKYCGGGGDVVGDQQIVCADFFHYAPQCKDQEPTPTCEETCPLGTQSGDKYYNYKACTTNYLGAYSFYKDEELKCQQSCSSSSVYYVTNCSSKGKGCDGEDTPVSQGYVYVSSNIGDDTIYCDPSTHYHRDQGVTCGSVQFYKDCIAGCSYSETPSSCAAQGKTFVLKCYVSDNEQYGECQ